MSNIIRYYLTVGNIPREAKTNWSKTILQKRQHPFSLTTLVKKVGITTKIVNKAEMS